MFRSIGVGVLMYIYEDLPAIPCQEMIDMEIEDSMWASVKLIDKDETNINIIDAVKHIQEMQGYTHILLMVPEPELILNP